jgi:regulatory protein
MEEATHIITQIETQKKNTGRFNIYLDGAFAFGLEEEVVLRHHLHKGDRLKASTIDEILLVEEKTRAKEKALAYLSYRMRSVEELRKKLNEKGFAGRTIEPVIEDLLRVGLLNDQQFASAYVRSRMIQKPMSKRLLLRELFARGIENTIAEETVEKEYGNHSEFEVAIELVRKKGERLCSDRIESRKIKKRISDFLARRGFNWDVIGEVIRELLPELN